MRSAEATTAGGASDERLYGLLAEYDTPGALLAAAEKVREAGFRRWDSHSPFPIHGMEKAMGIRMTILPWLVLGAGLTGTLTALLLQSATNAWHYPHIISGKPLNSLPAWVPIMFELTVLFAATAAFVGMLVLNLLPEFAHPLFRCRRFAAVTTDKYFVSIDARDPLFDPEKTRQLLEALGATAVEACHDSDKTAKFPRAFHLVGAVLTCFALVPLMLVLRAWNSTSEKPRIHIIPDMDSQPFHKAQRGSTFFADGRTSRLPPQGAVARGELRADPHLQRGYVLEGGQKKFFTTFPPAVLSPDPARNLAALRRGRERFNIYCLPCHGPLGDGKGMIALRANALPDDQKLGWLPPQNLLQKIYRDKPVGELFHILSEGTPNPANKAYPYKMPPYKAQIPVPDRWAIVMYIRALQRSQYAKPGDLEGLPAGLRQALE